MSSSEKRAEAGVVVPEFGTRGKAWLGVLVLAIVVGFGAWGYQLSQGLAVTGMNNVFSWGLYIMLFVLFIGLSAGGLIISSAPKFFHSDRYATLAPLGILLSLACIVVAGLLILPDLGRPSRVIGFLTSPDFRSPMVWDFGIVLVYGLFSAGYLWLLTRRDLAKMGSRLAFGTEDTEEGRKKDRKLAFWAAAVAIPLAIALHSVTGWIFATQIGRGDWFNPLVAPMFIMKALVSGLALLVVTAILVDRFTRFRLPQKLVPELGKVLGVFVAIHVVYLVAAERLPHAWASEFEFWAITSAFLVGDSIHFWLWTVVGGAVPIVLLAVPSLRRKLWVVFVASVLAIVGILFEGVYLLFTGYQDLNIDAAPGVTSGTDYVGVGSDVWVTAGYYTPTLVELLVTIGIVALGALIVTLGLRFVPIQPGGGEAVRVSRTEQQTTDTDASVATDGGRDTPGGGPR
ncbi:NrfD/PsrC family molybdoenzyme membrane anchor subunit [Natrarchaeobaculum sulfurireducens]|uniref:Anaerobic dimethyl sulfoxide reductase, membrane subunit n=1 Tax=Natrarchaeobaculum sulfurireducens TaxID=2044521 RepID=A0A346PRT1_9EURY|nr:NrfD/PsrC family molybdoenzyme membrane anchor subunit [Natrarchaeobaculum sulfurireducens]AXR77791.1 Polysulfide reductase, NrfD [Natrarchaeobaculum sulfurireducens]AXR82226.1 Anaerobic dimethyl sulfoxide reductase, membrane subunit [Natrarchaeobaculum sulfurireducens]